MYSLNVNNSELAKANTGKNDGCPACGSNNHEPIIPEGVDQNHYDRSNLSNHCNDCGHQWVSRH